MKKVFINKCMSYIKKNTNYDDIKLKEIEYGLVSIYLTVSKMIIIIIISLLLDIFKEMMVFSLIYNILRMPSFGLHATKSWICLIISIVIFIGGPSLCKVLNIATIYKIIISVLAILFIFKNSPADTKNKPIVNKNRRLKFKIISTIIAIAYSVLTVIIKSTEISNYFLISLILQNIVISPLTYKLFNQPYNNYIVFLKEHPDFKNG